MYTDSLELQIPGQMTNVTSSEMKIFLNFFVLGIFFVQEIFCVLRTCCPRDFFVLGIFFCLQNNFVRDFLVWDFLSQGFFVVFLFSRVQKVYNNSRDFFKASFFSQGFFDKGFLQYVSCSRDFFFCKSDFLPFGHFSSSFPQGFFVLGIFLSQGFFVSNFYSLGIFLVLGPFMPYGFFSQGFFCTSQSLGFF